MGRGGTTSLEVALALALLSGLILTTVDAGRYYATAQAVRELTGEVLRAAAVDSTLSGCTAPLGFVRYTPMLSDPGKLSVCVTRSGSSPTLVTIATSYQFAFRVALLLGRPVNLSETAVLTLP